MSAAPSTGAAKHKAKRSSIQMMSDLLGMGTSRMGEDQVDKLTLEHWNKFKTVSWRADAQRDYTEHTSHIIHGDSAWKRFEVELLTWLIPSFVGVLAAFSGAFIEYCVEWYSSLRFGICKDPHPFKTEETCNEGGFHAWGVGAVPNTNGYMFFVVISTFIAAVSATLTWAFAPMSKGSGIPEIKTILGGFTFPDVLSGRTLVFKIIGLAMSVGCGLACGKEGPLVHISCCWCNFVVKFFKRYKNNEGKQRELLSCACASGVAVAFGAPLGGVLFSLEEASTIFPMRTMLRAFCGSTVAAMTLQYLDVTGTGKLTMFNCPYTEPPRFIEYPIFMVMGILGGIIGAFFVHWNIKISVGRAPGTAFRAKCHIVLEVATISFFTAITSYYLLQTRVLSNTGIRAFFHNCAAPDVHGNPKLMKSFMLDLCDAENNFEPGLGWDLVCTIFLAGFLRLAQMTFTFGTGAAAGLFIPSLYVGAAMGRIFGIFMYDLNAKGHFVSLNEDTGGPFVNGIHPGMYAMLGAAGVLGGVCRVTISLVVIMFELTGGLQLIVPFMVVCMLAKWVGDHFTPGIYDYAIEVRKYPFLHEPDEVTFHHSAGDVMDVSIDCLHPEMGQCGKLIEFLEKAKHGGYPVTVSRSDNTLLGYMHTTQLLDKLNTDLEESPMISSETRVTLSKFFPSKPSDSMDVSDLIDEAVIVVVKETPAAQLQQIFRCLGVKLCLVRHNGQLIGMITKKAFIHHMEELHHCDHIEKVAGAHIGTVDLNAPLLPK